MIDYNYLKTLNERLKTIEQYIQNVYTFYDDLLIKQLDDIDNPMDDFELSFKLYGITNKKDENALVFIADHYISNGLGYIGDECIHHNELGIGPKELNAFKHCWLFHDMIDHHNLSLEQCCQFKDFWIDFNIQHQATFNVEYNKWLKNGI